MLFEGDKDIIERLVYKYLDNRSVALWPDERPGAKAPVKYRPYLKYEKSKTDFVNGKYIISWPEDISFGRGVSPCKMFDKINIEEDCRAGNQVIYETVLKEFKRMRHNEIIDAGRVDSLRELLRARPVRQIKDPDFACELVYVYACYEYWPSIRDVIHSILIKTGSARNVFKIVDDEGLEKAIEYIDPELLCEFKESGNLHKKADPPVGVDLNVSDSNEEK